MSNSVNLLMPFKSWVCLALCLASHVSLFAQYSGTGSVTQGVGTVGTPNLFVCPKGRPTNLGTIKSQDGRTWTVPAAVSFADKTFPASLDLHNACSGVTYPNTEAAKKALENSNVITVDADGEVYSAYIFADNYFEMYVNGVPVGKDNVPFTQFNSSVVKFRARRPFTIAMLAVDWEENLGLGSESMPGTQYHPGDAGIVVTITDQSGAIIDGTSPAWKAQVYYTSPVQDLTCLRENGNVRSSVECFSGDATDGSRFYGVHWERPAGWMNTDFDDSQWPQAVAYENNTVGVDNKPAYTNFRDVFDNASRDAEFIWTSNLVLDNEVLLRYRVPGTTSVGTSTNEGGDAEEYSELYSLDGVLIVRSTIDHDVQATLEQLPSGPYLRVHRTMRQIRTTMVMNLR